MTALIAAALLPQAVIAVEPSKIGVTVIVSGDAAATSQVHSALQASDLPVDFLFAPLPNVAGATPLPTSAEQTLSAARQSYIRANLRECVSQLASDGLLWDLLREGSRAQAARLLFWRAACEVGLGATGAARAEAYRLAELGLEPPSEAGSTTPEVERLVGEELKRAGRESKTLLHIQAPVPGASVSIDGRPGVCVVPCAIELLAGEHLVRVDADGMVSETRPVQLVPPGPTVLDIPLSAAGPELAAQQWTARYAGSTAFDSAPSVRLLARALRAQRLVLVTVDGAVERRLRGVFFSGSDVQAYAERYGNHALEEAARGLVEDLLVKGSVLQPPPPLFKRPLFWVVIGAAVAVAVAATYFATTPPPVTTQVHF